MLTALIPFRSYLSGAHTLASQKKVDALENKILTLQSEHSSLEQYGRPNNIGITGIPDSLPDQNLEEKVVDISNEISVNVSPKDIEACHQKIAQRKR